MAKLTHPGPLDFSNTQEQWSDWIKRFQRYRQASGLAEKDVQRQVDTLIYVMGDEAEKVYAQLNITAPTNDEAGANANLLYDRTVTTFTNYFQPTSNTLHYSILLSNLEQRGDQTNEQFIRELYEMAGKCGFTEEVKDIMPKMRLLAGMRDKALLRELQMDPEVTVETIKLKMRAKETIMRNQRIEIDGEKERTVAAVRRDTFMQGCETRSTRTAQKSLGRGAIKGENSSSRTAGDDFIKDCRFCGGGHARRTVSGV